MSIVNNIKIGQTFFEVINNPVVKTDQDDDNVTIYIANAIVVQVDCDKIDSSTEITIEWAFPNRIVQDKYLTNLPWYNLKYITLSNLDQIYIYSPKENMPVGWIGKDDVDFHCSQEYQNFIEYEKENFCQYSDEHYIPISYEEYLNKNFTKYYLQNNGNWY